MTNVIYRGPLDQQPASVYAPIRQALLPGIFVTIEGGVVVPATSTSTHNLMLRNRRRCQQRITEAYEESAATVGLRRLPEASTYKLLPRYRFHARFEAGTYATGDKLTISENSRARLAEPGERIIAFYQGAGATLAAGEFDDLEIAS